ncbi:uncharacterized protein LOC126471453 isoform X1 [Schistocerca serialis cubense]|uniref:uncharacterized protein LOC126471453 isoform X1 n=1 Tax=Schistocerca serialis cubense TaxID=2023355 RepID=UPI00214F5A60|nr:uncharacterized protein LOC126471453 isoform X1 [Schistocerca serialis cubense]XP_049955600.1 uncharacterized protein LOC126471453 isoform X1 [Schistocerca serialis cubense]
MGKTYDIIRYHVAPPLLIVGFTCGVQLLVLVGAGQPATLSVALSRCWGNTFSWTAVILLLKCAALSLHAPGPSKYGPHSSDKSRPLYTLNGVAYYVTTLLAFSCLLALRPDLADAIHQSHPELVGTLNLVALALCLWLLIDGKRRAQSDDPPRPIMYEFFRGMELHPRILGVDVKQWTNSRVGLMAWQLLVIAFFIAGVRRNGFSAAAFVTMILQTIYLAKFYYWEWGYFQTLDITLDRAGYYICWGCLVLVPSLYTFTSNYLVTHPPVATAPQAAAALVLGLASVLLNYRVDYEKLCFRTAKDGRCHLWGRPAQFLEAEYKDKQGRVHRTRLLVSGSWGVARHLNYTFEILSALAWSLPAMGLGILPFLYVIFLTLLLVHRVYRDEEKCQQKYGSSWQAYCRLVPYRLLPWIF